MAYKISLIPGDGIGPEIAEITMKVVEATGVKVDWEVVRAGVEIMAKEGTPLPLGALESIRRNRVALKAPITTPIGTGFRSVNVAIRKELDLFVCLRPCKIYNGVRSRYENVDLVIVRENTEDLYAGVEYPQNSKESQEIIRLSNSKIRECSAISIKSISAFATERVVRYAFEYALRCNRKKVTAVTKANIMKCTDGLFYETARRIARNYEDKIGYEERLIDNMCLQLVQKPELYDVIVVPNLYGDILSDLCAGLVGGLGVAPGANLGNDIAVFEAVHGSAPKYKGLNKVNPVALILSAKLMLEYLGETNAASRLEQAVSDVIMEKRCVTYDLGGTAGTKEMGQAIIEKL
ncbi:MAG: isocitrate/isopropylmalate dehydrogenase family protein [Endomicrobium sp.]|jgi:isocitrate dehydrogenase (NAD+)|nr:isocitrate/isopropylmalate dehydrogenase family protein [Endomicrobium sp.]